MYPFAGDCSFVNGHVASEATRVCDNSAPTDRRSTSRERTVLEITCQDCEVEVVPLRELRILRVSDVLAGIIINIPLTVAVLVSLAGEA